MKNFGNITRAVVCTAAALLFPVSASSQSPSEKAKPVWSLDLTHTSDFESAQTGFRLEHAQIAFIAENAIAVAFLAHGDESGSGLALVCVILNANTRRVEKTLTWTTPYKNYNSATWAVHRWVVPTNYGEFLIFTGSKLIRYNGNFEPLQERAVADPFKTTFTISPLRNLLLLSEFVRTGKFRQTIVSTADLRNQREFGESMPSTAIADDGAVLRLAVNWTGKTVPAGCRTPLAEWESPDSQTDCGPVQLANGQTAFFCTSATSCSVVSSRVTGIPTFVGEDAIFSPSTLNDYVLLDRAGKILYAGTYSTVRNESGQRSVSSDTMSRRFSFVSSYSEVLPLPSAQVREVERVHVFDLTAMKPLSTITFESALAFDKNGRAALWSFDHAVSPEGTQLAVLRNSELELFRLP